MDRHPTPEERLLNLIRRKDGKQKAALEKDREITKPAVVANPLRLPELPVLEFISFKNFKSILVVIIIIIVLYILTELMPLKADENKLARTVSRNQAENQILMIRPAAVRPYSYYSGQFDQRDIFESNPSVGIAKPATANANLPQLTKGLKLVGVILDNNPQAIIENSAENKTYFLHKGEVINDLKLEAITESKAILSYGSEKLELAL